MVTSVSDVRVSRTGSTVFRFFAERIETLDPASVYVNSSSFDVNAPIKKSSCCRFVMQDAALNKSRILGKKQQ
jgi:hypothetical protein